jgi:hypothetical protein
LEAYARRWPALAEARLAVVAGDGATNNIGAGCTTKNDIALMIGTSGAMRVVSKGDPPETLSPALWSYRAARTRVAVGGALSDGGGLIQWLRASLNVETTDLGNEPDAHGLTILPFWSGERSTGWSPEARGVIFGLRQETQPAEIVRATLEAIAYRFASIARALEITAVSAPGARIVATGNALRSSRAWIQIIADVLGRPVTLGTTAEASIRGAALLALEAVGKIAAIEDVSVPTAEVFQTGYDAACPVSRRPCPTARTVRSAIRSTTLNQKPWRLDERACAEGKLQHQSRTRPTLHQHHSSVIDRRRPESELGPSRSAARRRADGVRAVDTLSSSQSEEPEVGESRSIPLVSRSRIDAALLAAALDRLRPLARRVEELPPVGLEDAGPS